MQESSNFLFESCENCGKEFQRGEKYPVVTRQKDGTAELYSFCDEKCQEEWSR